MANTHFENQTQFSAEEPFFENPGQVPVGEVVVKERVPLLKRRKSMIALLSVVAVSSLLLLYGYAQYVTWQRRLGTPEEIMVPTPAPLAPSELSAQAQSLRAELKLADPVKQELLFPQIDLSLRLEERPR